MRERFLKTLPQNKVFWPPNNSATTQSCSATKHQSTKYNTPIILTMGGAKKWLDPHVKFCFSKFTNCENEDGKWCIVGADSDGDRVLVVPNATRGGLDPVKQWYEEACEERTELFSTINLQCFRINVQNTAKKWLDGAPTQQMAQIPQGQKTTTTQLVSRRTRMAMMFLPSLTMQPSLPRMWTINLHVRLSCFMMVKATLVGISIWNSMEFRN